MNTRVSLSASLAAPRQLPPTAAHRPPLVKPIRIQAGLKVDDIDLRTRRELGQPLYDIFCESYGELGRDTVCDEIVFRSGATLYLIRDAADTIVGFGTIAIPAVKVRKRTYGLLQSGVYFRRDIRGGGALWTRLGARVATMYKLRHPSRPLYSVIESLTPVTYRRMMRDFPAPFPSRNDSDSPELSELLATFVERKGLERPTTNPFVVAYPDPASHQSDSAQLLSDELRADPEVQFYLEQNPHFADGHILCVLIPLNWGDLVRTFSRQLLARTRRR